MSLPYELLFKIIVIGNSGSGKSSLCSKLSTGKIPYHYDTTIGVEFFSKLVNINIDNIDKVFKIHMWDTAGQEAFRSIIKSYYRDIGGVFLVCDITKRRSFNDLKYWMEELKENGPFEHKPDIILLVNKTDVDKSRYEIGINEINKFCSENNIDYLLTSIKDDSIEEAALLLIKKMYNRYLLTTSKEGLDEIPGIRGNPVYKDIYLSKKRDVCISKKEECCIIM